MLIPGQNELEQGQFDELELLPRLRALDSVAFLALYDRFHRQVFRYLMHVTGSHHESEELLQVVFVAVWKGMTTGMFERFDPARGALEAYLLGIARNAARKLLARRGRIVSVEDFEVPDQALGRAEQESGISAIERELEIQRLRKAIMQLPIEYREAITLCCLQDLSYEQAAKAMNCSVGTVGSRVNRGKGMLRKALSVPCSSAQITTVVVAR